MSAKLGKFIGKCKASFLLVNLPNISGELTFTGINCNTKLLAGNAAAIGTHCHPLNHASLVLTAPILAMYIHLPYVQLVDPGNAPIYPLAMDDVAYLTICMHGAQPLLTSRPNELQHYPPPVPCNSIDLTYLPSFNMRSMAFVNHTLQILKIGYTSNIHPGTMKLCKWCNPPATMGHQMWTHQCTL